MVPDEGRPTRVFVVDDHALIPEGVASVLDSRFDVVGSAATVEGAVSAISDLRPDVVLVDVNLGEGGHGASVVSQARSSATAFLALSALVEREAVMAMIEVGAAGYITKSDVDPASERLPRAIEMVAAGIPYFSRELAFMIRVELHVWEELSPAEQEIMEMVIAGADPAEVADKLHIPLDRVHETFQRVLELARRPRG